MSNTNEHAFEESIEQSLTSRGGYVKGSAKSYDRETAMDISVLMSFIKSTQKDEWDKLAEVHGDDVESKFLYRLNKELDNRGMLDCLRNGITDYGKKFKLAYFKPASGLNPETIELYGKNILTVTRQVHYSLKSEKSIDILLSINGLPVITMELKNAFTGQDVENAKRQYKYDREENELLFQFKKRALVHFAVDTDEVYMTTRVQGSRTAYLPFNKGDNKGAGNPVNPDGHKTAYLWEQILAKDSIMDIIAGFMHLEIKEIPIDDKIIKKETMIFPRYHQLDVVRKISADVFKNGAGSNYLIQHSAGSGKSNSIAWLAYRLAGMHNTEDNRVFDTVVVVTDRRVLDKQLQDTIYQFEHKTGVVEKIDKNSGQLAEALIGGTNIIITTLQKFPFVMDKVKDIPGRKYAVIVDEAHSSQGGESASKMRYVLSDSSFEEIAAEDTEEYGEKKDEEDSIREVMEKRGPQPNLSFFAFTATPKTKTMEVFGTKNTEGKPEPFHLYSMRQAIEEGFIMDVLRNYTTYKTFFGVTKKIQDDPSVVKKKAAIAIARFVSLHPYNLAQKSEVIIEHFRQIVMPKIGGKAKAMVVTASRAHVVRYKQEFDKYLREKGYTHIKALVAFSGTVVIDGVPGEFTEPGMNGFKEKELPEKFNTNDYRILLVAEKYQTGYDQPLLHTMYVDKRLDGVKAVQTLSRLNRVCPGKEDTFVLDFVNERDEILAAFQPYYEQTEIEDVTDPNRLYDLKTAIDAYMLLKQEEIDAFCRIFFAKKERLTKDAHAKMNFYVDSAAARFKELKEDEQKENFANSVTVFVRLYAFVSQIMPFSDIDLEKYYAYCRFLLRKLPKRNAGERYRLDDEVALEYYRLNKAAEGDLELKKGEGTPLPPGGEAGNREDKEQHAKLSEIIKLLNDRFGTEFTQADKLFFDSIEEEMILDEKLEVQAKNNPIGNFKFGFEDLFMEKVVSRMDQNKDIFEKLVEDKAFAAIVIDYLMRRVYSRFNRAAE